MAHNLESTFRELGLTQYLDAFVDQGFDTWDIILDIQESDLDALGVKLGHRRKLQRRIANARGIAPSVSLPTSSKAGSDDVKQDGPRPEQGRHDCNHENGGVTKRKYRRHPKPDENAPERPPSAYVLFSNKMRENVKNQNLSFTEIAKLVGENWQCLPTAEKEAYETQANNAKEKYHRDLAAYKKTPEYRKYAQYLQEFKERQAKQNQEPKRTRVEPARLRHGSTSSSATPASGSGSGSLRGSRSSSERMPGSEPSPTRQDRMDSAASMSESVPSSALPIHHPRRVSMEDGGTSPKSSAFESALARRDLDNYYWREHGRTGEPTQQQALPSLSDVLDDGKGVGFRARPVSEANASYTPGFVPVNQRLALLDGPPSARIIPPLQHDISSNSSSLSSSISSFGPSPMDGPLPVPSVPPAKAVDTGLVSPFGQTPPNSALPPSPPQSRVLPKVAVAPSFAGLPSGPSPTPISIKTEPPRDADVMMASAGSTAGLPKLGFDGMSALLKAGEIVDRRIVD